MTAVLRGTGRPAPELVAPRAARSSGPRRRWAGPVLRTLGPLALIGLWQLAVVSGVLTPDVLTGPGTVLRTGRDLWADGQLQEALRVSLTRAAIGLALGASAGLVIGTVAGLTRLGEELIDSSMQMLRAIPFLSLVPLFIVWFGIEEISKIILITVACTFPMYINVYSGVRNTDRKVVEAARTFGLSPFQIVRQVVLPGALPSIFAGLRLASTLSVIALIAAEELNVTSGLGYLMNQAKDYLRTDVLAVCVLLYSLVGLLADLVLRLAERLVMPWRKAVAVR
ncbi:ABC transporter permease [Actinocorallia longicatena]|uniref:ABC transporter permease n=1 Tax=Actinocorallia longicatena TaxID=111803 RepID=A0ABP6Q825_9ACTN